MKNSDSVIINVIGIKIKIKLKLTTTINLWIMHAVNIAAKNIGIKNEYCKFCYDYFIGVTWQYLLNHYA